MKNVIKDYIDLRDLESERYFTKRKFTVYRRTTYHSYH